MRGHQRRGSPSQARRRRRARSIRLLFVVAVVVAGILLILARLTRMQRTATLWFHRSRAVAAERARLAGALRQRAGSGTGGGVDFRPHAGACAGVPRVVYTRHLQRPSARDLFGLVRQAYSSLTLPPQFADVHQAIEQAPSAVAAAFVHANPHLPPQSVVVSCSGQSTPRLREVHVCFDRDLKPRACSADALRAGCRAASLIVPPVR